jgi:pimeloyl-ACP methyl ester carboxylesterase
VQERRRPLIFLPGVAGSTLKEVGGAAIWPRKILRSAIRKLTLDPSKPLFNLYPSDIVRTVRPDIPQTPDRDVIRTYRRVLEALIHPNGGGYTEYELRHDAHGRIIWDRSLLPSTQRPLFVFPYDWRRAFDHNVAALQEFVGQVQHLLPDTKVDMVAHSTGGLLARRYILDNPGKVEKLVTVGTPWLGAPKALWVLDSGMFFEQKLIDELNSFLVSCCGEAEGTQLVRDIKALVKFFPGVHGLLPSSWLYELLRPADRPILREAGWDLNGVNGSAELYGYDDFLGALDRVYAYPLDGVMAGAGSVSRTFYEYHNDRGAQQDWRQDATGVQYYHFVGCQRPTIVRLEAQTRVSCVEEGLSGTCWETPFLQPFWGDGDGTVPFVSAARVHADTNLNSPSFGVVEVIRGGEHTGMLDDPRVQFSILSKLGPAAAPLPPPPSCEPVNAPVRSILAFGAKAIKVVKKLGQVVSGAAAKPVILALGEHAFAVLVPDTGDFELQLTASELPLSLEIREGTTLETTDAIRYLDAAIPADALLTMSLGESTVGPLYIDHEGDGSSESMLPPTIVLSGPEAADVDPPTVQMTSTIAGSQTEVSLSATDSGSGLAAIYYSVDGTSYARYEGPFAVDGSHETMLTVFADDQAGNRSGTATFQLASIVQGGPDLVVSELHVPASAFPGQDISAFIRVGIANAGDQVAVGTLTSGGAGGYMVDYVLSKDTQVPSGWAPYSPYFAEDVLLLGARASYTPDLGPQETAWFQEYATIPEDTPPGAYFFCVQVDPGNALVEPNDTNNVACAPLTVEP